VSSSPERSFWATKKKIVRGENNNNKKKINASPSFEPILEIEKRTGTNKQTVGEGKYKYTVPVTKRAAVRAEYIQNRK